MVPLFFLGRELLDPESLVRRRGEEHSTARPTMAEKGRDSHAYGYEILILTQVKVRHSPKGKSLCFTLWSARLQLSMDPLARLKEIILREPGWLSRQST